MVVFEGDVREEAGDEELGSDKNEEGGEDGGCGVGEGNS